MAFQCTTSTTSTNMNTLVQELRVRTLFFQNGFVKKTETLALSSKHLVLEHGRECHIPDNRSSDGAGGDRSPGIAGVILWCKGYVDAAIQCNTYRELHDFVQFARKPLGFICFFGVCPCFESGSHYVCRFE